mmetsp:Transcript_95992/g.309939  ORF Transcript_95992/g.309939 Transcript_95992/m.309939 type:complete len:211 (-) Transcript_95992:942-1574(-)
MVERQGVVIGGVYLDGALVRGQSLLVALPLQVHVRKVELHARGAQLLEAVRHGDGVRGPPVRHAARAEPCQGSPGGEQGDRPEEPLPAAAQAREVREAHDGQQQPRRRDVQQALADDRSHREEHVRHGHEAEDHHGGADHRALVGFAGPHAARRVQCRPPPRPQRPTCAGQQLRAGEVGRGRQHEPQVLDCPDEGHGVQGVVVAEEGRPD